MSDALLLITFLSVVAILTVLAKRARIPYPIAFVFGGVALAFSRHLPHPHFDPEIVLLLVLPPLLYSAAWSTDWVQLKRSWRMVSLLAVGLVIFTTVVVAAFLHAAMPGFSWALAFTLGAIVSPPDAVAAEAVFERLAIPRRIAAIITGECLLNDATALVTYRFALAALVSGAFSLARAGIDFIVVSVGGVLVGVAIALAIEGILRYVSRHDLDDATLASVVLLIAPFAAYVPAEAVHVSGVLGAVSAGLVLSRRSALFIDSETRVIGSSVWRLLTFVLNGLAFLLIGLQLPVIVAELVPRVGIDALFGLALSVLVIAVRFAWVFPATYLPRMFDRRLRESEPAPTWQGVTVVSWAGMRGIVSLAAALALPYTLGDEPFPQRSIAIFLTFSVIFVTLVGQGLTLGPLVEWLGVAETSKNQQAETRVRIRALEAAIARLRELQEDEATGTAKAEAASRVMEEYEHRIGVLHGRANPEVSDEDREILADRTVAREALAAERRAIVHMRSSGELPDAVFRSIEYDLDLAALQLS
ncbi:MAG TPA: Na+/H+ antiporter [Candidatus Acidoferrales bacterium]|nr:Na+/H+ antiporter [Candidatus Acidoferrales bacterium]